MSNKRQRKKATIERAASFSNAMGIQGDYSKYAGGNSVTIPTNILVKMLQNLAPQSNQAKDFAPGSPLQPYEGVVPKSGPRQWSYSTGINLNSNDRTLGNPNIPGFEQLRLFSMLYSGVGLCERVTLDMIPKLEPKVTLRKDLAEGGADEKNFQPQIKRWMQFLEEPSPAQQLDIHSWLRMAWTEQTQIDALAMFKHKNRGGKLYGLEIIDGSTIKPVLDERGMIPLANQGFPAYQQYPYGVPGDLYTTDSLLYYRESPRAFTPYGFSRVERIILEVNQALNKKRKDLARYTEGNVPAGIMEVPDTSQWSPDQIEAYEMAWNSLLGGNAQQQVRVKFTQPGMKYTRIDDVELNTPFDMFLLNTAAGCYGLSMGDLGFTEEIHKSSGDSQQNMMFRRTLAPFVLTYSRILTKVLRESFGDDELEVSFGGYEEAEDLQTQATAYASFAGIGAISPSSIARLMKFPDVPETGPFLLPPGGQPLFLEDLANPTMRKAQQDAQMAGYQMATQAPQMQQQQMENGNDGKDTQSKDKADTQKQAKPTQKANKVNAGSNAKTPTSNDTGGSQERSFENQEYNQFGISTMGDSPYRRAAEVNTEVSRYEQRTLEDTEGETLSQRSIVRGNSEVTTGTTESNTEQPSTEGSNRDAKAISAEYKRWRARAVEDVKDGKTQRFFVTTIIPHGIHDYISQCLHACTTPDHVRSVFTRAQAQEGKLIDNPPQLQYNANLDIWEPWDTEQQLQAMIAKGAVYLRWTTGVSVSGVCPVCEPNSGQIVEVGSTFKSGHRVAGCHLGCCCGVEKLDKDKKAIR
jgi:hypothetical protein